MAGRLSKRDSLFSIVRKYEGCKHVRGTADCNLMFFDLYEPQVFKLMYKHYSGIIDGVAHAKRVLNVRSVREYLRKNSYELINSNFQQQGDVVVFPKGLNVYLSLGDMWFGVDKDDVFRAVAYEAYSPSDYLVFRKI